MIIPQQSQANEVVANSDKHPTLVHRRPKVILELVIYLELIKKQVKLHLLMVIPCRNNNPRYYIYPRY